MKQYIKTKTIIGTVFLATSLAMSLATTTRTFAAPKCSTHDLIASTLAEKYNETPRHRGLTQAGTMVEIFSSKTGTFTVVITMPTGMSCLMAAGTHWQKTTAVNQGLDKDTSGGVDREF
ncbi:MAG: hypothetical protein QM488_14140 [Rhizobiaceae bacterium]